MSFLYVISASPLGPVKLGYSKHPDKRLRQLQTGNPEVLVLRHCEEVELVEVRKAERKLHQALGPWRKSGEWFALTVENAILEAVHARMCI